LNSRNKEPHQFTGSSVGKGDLGESEKTIWL